MHASAMQCGVLLSPINETHEAHELRSFTHTTLTHSHSHSLTLSLFQSTFDSATWRGGFSVHYSFHFFTFFLFFLLSPFFLVSIFCLRQSDCHTVYLIII